MEGRMDGWMDGWMDVCLDWVEKEANNSVCAASLKYSQHDHMSVQRERERERGRERRCTTHEPRGLAVREDLP